MEKIEDKINFVLVKPRSPGNVGSVARVLKNFDFRNLILVDPRLHKNRDTVDGSYFNIESERMACKGIDILKKAKIVETVDEAISDSQFVIGTDPDPPNYQKCVSPEEMAEEVVKRNLKTAILFGTESDGLTNEEISKCTLITKIKTGNYCDLNLSQSLVIIAYTLFIKIISQIEETSKEDIVEQKLLDEVVKDFLEIAVKSGFTKSDDSKIALELSNIVRNFNLSERSAGILRSLIIRIKAKIS
jgi:TrmH family RNA methyltransferase